MMGSVPAEIGKIAPMSESSPAPTPTEMEAKGYIGLTLTVLGLLLFLLIYGVPVASFFLIPALVLCRTEANRYQRDTGRTAGVLIVAQVLCWFFGGLAVLVDFWIIVAVIIWLVQR
jgi:hypothetical protein